jgi:hypothetical protein
MTFLCTVTIIPSLTGRGQIRWQVSSNGLECGISDEKHGPADGFSVSVEAGSP